MRSVPALVTAFFILQVAKGHQEGLEKIIHCATGQPLIKYLGKIIEKLGCPQRQSQIVYNVECRSNGTIICPTGTNNACAYSLCECQRLFAICIAQHKYPDKKPQCC
uniref:Uncharacterized protein n=1 Tax=Trichuris muris TaxID=70415 RepID=A0A5S6QU41_TRIMR